MTKTGLIREYSNMHGIELAKAELAVNSIFKIIESKLSKKERVSISGFGTFKIVKRPMKKGSHTITKQPIMVSERSSILFKPGKVIESMLKPTNSYTEINR